MVIWVAREAINVIGEKYQGIQTRIPLAEVAILKRK